METTHPVTTEKLEALCASIDADQAARYARHYPGLAPYKAHIHHGRRWVRVDIGNSGAYMIDQDGSILGIKAYGVPHPGHRYGTLDTIAEWFWGEYRAVRKVTR